MKQHVICTKEEEIGELTGSVARIEGKLDNGLSSRIKVAPRAAWVQVLQELPQVVVAVGVYLVVVRELLVEL